MIRIDVPRNVCNWDTFKKIVLGIDCDSDSILTDAGGWIHDSETDTIFAGDTPGNTDPFTQSFFIWYIGDDLELIKQWVTTLDNYANDCMVDGFAGNFNRDDYNTVQNLITFMERQHKIHMLQNLRDEIESCDFDDKNYFCSGIGATITAFENDDYTILTGDDLGRLDDLHHLLLHWSIDSPKKYDAQMLLIRQIIADNRMMGKTVTASKIEF